MTKYSLYLLLFFPFWQNFAPKEKYAADRVSKNFPSTTQVSHFFPLKDFFWVKEKQIFAKEMPNGNAPYTYIMTYTSSLPIYVYVFPLYYVRRCFLQHSGASVGTKQQTLVFLQAICARFFAYHYILRRCNGEFLFLCFGVRLWSWKEEGAEGIRDPVV